MFMWRVVIFIWSSISSAPMALNDLGKCAFSKPETLHRQYCESVSTHVFPLDEHQIIWCRRSTVAWYNNGLSIQGSHAFWTPHCNTKGNRLLLLLNIYCTITGPTEESHKSQVCDSSSFCAWVLLVWSLTGQTWADEVSNMCPHLTYGVLVHVKPQRFQ